MFFTTSLLLDLFGVCAAITAIIITYYKWSFQHWKKRNVPFLEPAIPFGNLENFFRATKAPGVKIKDMYDYFKKQKLPHGGAFFLSRPTWIPVDLDYVKNILAKDFQHFVDRGIYYNEKHDPLSAHLFAIGGNKWRNLRVKLTPTFTSGKLKAMFQTLVDCEKSLQIKMEEFNESRQPIDIKELLGCFTTNIIGSCAFGLDFNTFEDNDSPFRKYGKRFFTPTLMERLKLSFCINFPETANFLKVKQTPEDVSNFFMKVVEDTVKYREENNYSRKDFLQLLIDLKNNKLAEEEGYKHDGKTLSMDEIAAQSFIFFGAGFETSSTTVTFALFELAKNQQIQQKLRDEINTVLANHDGKITYEAMQDMKYMNQVLDETLRKYPPVPFITRVCVKDYKVPGEDLIIEKGTRVGISIFGIHHDEEYYPDPEKFDPERFNEVNSKKRHHYAHIPFGEGPRICIGARFGIMQSKVGLTSLLKNYIFTLNEKTDKDLKFAINSFVLSTVGGIWLDAEKV